MMANMNKRFEVIDKRFEVSDKRLEDLRDDTQTGLGKCIL